MDRENHWYAANVRHNTEKKVKDKLESLNIENFIPFHSVMVETNGIKTKKDKPKIPGLVFIHTDYQTALSITNEYSVEISYIKDHYTKSLLVVPDKQMSDFMFVLDLSEDSIKVDNSSLKRGERVRVIKGNFSGIEGELVRIKGHKRVVVRLEGLFSLATTYIPLSFLERV